jgi:hypothetical protein
MDMSPAGKGRRIVSLALIGLFALSARFTMEPGKWQTLTFVLLGFFAVRVILLRPPSR